MLNFRSPTSVTEQQPK